MEIKVRRKYMIGKTPGNSCQARTNNKAQPSIGESLFAQWLGITANRTKHNEMKAELAKAPIALLDRKGGKVVEYMTREQLSDIWGRK